MNTIDHEASENAQSGTAADGAAEVPEDAVLIK
jgi:hypothetical protein